MSTAATDERSATLRKQAGYRPVGIDRDPDGKPSRAQLEEIRALNRNLDRFGRSRPAVSGGRAAVSEWEPGRVKTWLQSQGASVREEDYDW